MPEYHLTQVNIARMLAPLDDASMAGFVARLAEVNALADVSPGFVWRLQSEAGDATYLRPYEDDRILFNMSVWRSLEELREFVYRSGHGGVMRQRKQWFAKFDGAYTALWWVEAGRVPSIEEAKQRLELLRVQGPTAEAFSFAQTFAAPVDVVAGP